MATNGMALPERNYEMKSKWPYQDLFLAMGGKGPVIKFGFKYLEIGEDPSDMTYRIDIELHNGQSVTLKDPRKNFPSQRLVNQINLLRP